jgi:hypothetical protein
LLFTHATTTGSISPAAVSPKRKAGRQPTSAESNSDERTGANKRVKRSNGSEDAVASPKSPSATEVDAELEVLAEAAADEERVAVETERQTQILAALGKAMASGALDGNFLGRLFPLYLEVGFYCYYFVTQYFNFYVKNRTRLVPKWCGCALRKCVKPTRRQAAAPFSTACSWLCRFFFSLIYLCATSYF